MGILYCFGSKLKFVFWNYIHILKILEMRGKVAYMKEFKKSNTGFVINGVFRFFTEHNRNKLHMILNTLEIKSSISHETMRINLYWKQIWLNKMKKFIKTENYNFNYTIWSIDGSLCLSFKKNENLSKRGNILNTFELLVKNKIIKSFCCRLE